MASNGRSRFATKIGALLRTLRQQRGLSQTRLAELSGMSQQWLSKIEAGTGNPTVLELERLFDGLGMLPRLEASRVNLHDDPDLWLSMTDADGELLANEYGYLLRKLANVPLLVAGRLAALAHGLPVHVRRLDIIIAEADRMTFAGEFQGFGAWRWNERWQEFRDLIPADRPGPMRWLIGGKRELRVTLIDHLPPHVDLTRYGLTVPVPPLPWLLNHDPDIATVLAKLQRAGWQHHPNPS